MHGFLLPAVVSGLIVVAAFDIHRNRDSEKRKRKRVGAHSSYGFHDIDVYPWPAFIASSTMVS